MEFVELVPYEELATQQNPWSCRFGLRFFASFTAAWTGYSPEMSNHSEENSGSDAVLVGGPHDGDKVRSGEVGLIEIPENELVHRYIRTGQSRDSATVYNYDGVVNPAGAEDGIENSADRVATSADPDAV